jgi:protein TonB
VNFTHDARGPARHLTGLFAVVLLHIALGWALASGLARKVVEVIKAPIETRIIEEVKPPPPPPENLPPPPKFAPPPPSFVPPPEVAVAPPPVHAPTITTTQAAPPPAPVAIGPPTAPVDVPAPVAARPAIANVASCAPRSEDYPSAALRAEAAGMTRIRFTIDGESKLVKTEIVKSAGGSREHRLLDRVAAEKLSTCRFTAGIDANGRAVGGTFDVEYVWKIQ